MSKFPILHQTKSPGIELVHMLVKASGSKLLQAPLFFARPALNLLGSGLTPRNYESKTIQLDHCSADWITPQGMGAPNPSQTILLYFHGGAYRIGSPKSHLPFLVPFTNMTSMPVLAVDYRLAPEHPYPAPLQDAMDAWNWLQKQGYKNVVVAGDSAGGHLTLSLLLQLKNEGKPAPICAIAISPWTNLATGISGSRFDRAALDPMLTNELLELAKHDFGGAEPLDHPLLSPLFGDYTGSCPIQIHVADREILFDDSMELFKRLIKSDHDVELHVWNGLFHVFQLFGRFVTDANESILLMGRFIEQRSSQKRLTG